MYKHVFMNIIIEIGNRYNYRLYTYNKKKLYIYIFLSNKVNLYVIVQTVNTYNSQK